MSADPTIRRTGKNLWANRGGNFATATAIMLPIILAAAGIGIDLSHMMSTKTALQSAMDAASLASSSALADGTITTGDVTAFAQKIAVSELTDNLTDAQKAALKSSITTNVSSSGTGSVKSYTVKVSGSYAEPLIAFSFFYGGSTVNIAAASESQSQTQSTNAMSLYLVLDRSGSMSFVTDTVDTRQTRCQNYTEANWYYYPNLPKSKPCYINKIGSLKTAAGVLFDELDDIENADTTNKIVRVGAVSFTDTTSTPSPLAWGTTNARNYVNNLPAYPTGGTDMTGGMKLAFDSLTSSSEASAQAAKGNSKFYKFIVLMTDGENTGSSSNWNPSLDTQTLATCKSARDAGIKIYTVAYMAPSNGEALLKSCAGDPSNFFRATDMNSLVTAFQTIGTKVSEQTTRMLN